MRSSVDAELDEVSEEYAVSQLVHRIAVGASEAGPHLARG